MTLSAEQQGREPMELRTSAPGLFRSLHRAFTAPEMARIERAFAVSCALGGADEAGISRTDGASYAPRPARIVKILRDEVRESRPEILAAAALAAVDQSRSAEIVAVWPDDGSVINLMWALSDGNAVPGDGARRDAERLLFARTLDFARHLHMSSEPEEQLLSFEASVRATILSVPCSPENERLVVMLRSWCDRIVEQLR